VTTVPFKVGSSAGPGGPRPSDGDARWRPTRRHQPVYQAGRTPSHSPISHGDRGDIEM